MMETKEDQGGTIVVLAKACEVQMGLRWAGRVMVLQMTPVYIQLREAARIFGLLSKCCRHISIRVSLS